MRRIENFRKGDRAEKFGVFLLQTFCAVAEVPRQEDFGLMDAVATLLRRDDRYLYAEDTFLAQMKSRTQTRIEYLGTRFEALLSQDLSIMIAHVDLTQSSIELHSLGIAIGHPNINEAEGLVVYLSPDEPAIAGLVDKLLHISLNKPILRWTVSDVESRAFRDNAYLVLKEWLTMERWNRQYRRAGMSRGILWETNEVPKENGELFLWNPARSKEALTDIVPAVRILANHATTNPELRAPAVAIMSWLRNKAIEADENGCKRLMFLVSDARERLQEALKANPNVDVVETFIIVAAKSNFIDFWIFGRHRKGDGGSSRHTGTLQAIREQGFDVKVEEVGDGFHVILGFTESWLSTNSLKLTGETFVANTLGLEASATTIFLFRKVAKRD